MVKVLIVAAPYKLHFLRKMTEFFPSEFVAEMIPKKVFYDEKFRFFPSSKALKVISHFNPDLIYSDDAHYPAWFAKFYSWCKKKTIPLIYRARGEKISEVWDWFNNKTILSEKLLFPHYFYFSWSSIWLADKIFPICEWLAKKLNSRFPDKEMEVVYQGINPSLFYPEEGTKLKHPCVGLVQDYNIFLKVRGLIYLRPVMEQLKGVHFYLAGDGKLLPKAKEEFKDMENVHFMGRVQYPSGLRQFLTEIDLYMLASGQDCCPTTVLEAGLMKKPVLASRIGGVPEIVKEGKTGWTIKNQNIEQWKKKINLLLQNKKIARKMGRAGRRWVVSNFHWKKISNQVSNAMLRVLESI